MGLLIWRQGSQWHTDNEVNCIWWRHITTWTTLVQMCDICNSMHQTVWNIITSPNLWHMCSSNNDNHWCCQLFHCFWCYGNVKNIKLPRIESCYYNSFSTSEKCYKKLSLIYVMKAMIFLFIKVYYHMYLWSHKRIRVNLEFKGSS